MKVFNPGLGLVTLRLSALICVAIPPGLEATEVDDSFMEKVLELDAPRGMFENGTLVSPDVTPDVLARAKARAGKAKLGEDQALVREAANDRRESDLAQERGEPDPLADDPAPAPVEVPRGELPKAKAKARQG